MPEEPRPSHPSTTGCIAPTPSPFTASHFRPLRVACYSYPTDLGCWYLTKALELVGTDAVNCITTHHYFDHPYWFDVSKEGDRVKYERWLKEGGEPEVILVNKHPLWSRPYPVTVPSDDEKKRIIWHRGSIYRRNYERINDEERSSGLVRIASTLDLLRFGKPDLQWFPVPIPVDHYGTFRRRRRGGSKAIRFFHSPTVREAKGTEVFLECLNELKHESRDYDDLELVLVERLTHDECMKVRGTCDVVFDQANNLCYGNSGLEAASLKMPVIANAHPSVYEELTERGIQPWFIDPGFGDKARLKDCVKELHNDASFRKRIGGEAYRYVKRWHDLPVSARGFLSLIERGWAFTSQEVITKSRLSATPLP